MNYTQELYDLGANLAFRLSRSTLFEKEGLTELKPITIRSITGRPFNSRSNTLNFSDAVIEHFKLVAEQGRTRSVLEENCHVFRRAYNLPEQAATLLALIALNSLSSPFNEFMETQAGLSNNHLYQLLSDGLKIDYLTLQEILDSLAKTGLWEELSYSAADILLIPPQFARSLAVYPASNFAQLISHAVELAPAPELRVKDFGHLENDIPFSLARAIKKHPQAGTNILFYGEPGVGKTQLARLVASEINANLFEVKALGSSLTHPDDELSSRYSSAQLRLQYLRMAQRLFAQRSDHWLVIDECEDIFSSFNLSTRVSKELLHNLLEQSAVPTIWITNSPDFIPSSCLRRFSYVLEVPNLPIETKQVFIDKNLKGLRVSRSYKSKLLKAEAVTPALLEKGASLCRRCNVTGGLAEDYIDAYLKGLFTAHGKTFDSNEYSPELTFDPDYCNVAGEVTSLEDVLSAIEGFPEARVLLYGAPGTGKSAFVNYVCEQLELPLLTVKASDILGKYVGESEKNIAYHFNHAAEAGKALLLDEADSLIATREGASKSWEVSQVNELLIQIERFTHPLFIATNFFERLDKALLRRIDFKVELRPLSCEQSSEVFEEVMNHVPSKSELMRLEHLTSLTAGDFAVLSRRKRFKKGKLNPTEALALLEAEHRRKEIKRRIGF